MENKEGQRPRRSSSPEAKAYRVWLKEGDKEQGALPPKEKREKLKKTLKDVRNSQQNAQETEEQKAKREAREKGEKRLREVVERGDLEASFLQYVGACLECEPWEALARIERKEANNPDLLQVQISSNSSFLEAFKDWVGRAEKDLGWKKEKDEERIRAERVPRLMMALDRHWFAQMTANMILRSEKKQTVDKDFGNTVGDPTGHSCLLRQEKTDRIEIPAKEYLNLREYGSNDRKYVPFYEQRSDYWTMVRAILAAHPKVYGFSTAREVDRAIGKRVEQIGRIFGVEFRLVDGVARIGETPVKTEALESLEKADAEAIIAVENRARLAVENREQQFKEEMQKMCRDLLDLNEKIENTSTALVAKSRGMRGVVDFLKEVLGDASRKESQKSQEASLKALRGKREELAGALEKKNDEKWSDKSWKYASRLVFSDDSEGFGDKNWSEVDLVIHKWTAIAETEAEKMVDKFVEE